MPAYSRILLPWDSQPQEVVEVNPDLTTLLVPARGGTFREAVGSAWTYSNAGDLSSGVAAFGRAVVNANTGYLSRTNTHTAGPITVGFTFTPSTISGTEGFWSLGDTAASAGAHFIIQRNGADLRLYFGSAYRLTITGVFAVGVPCNIVCTFSDTVYAIADCTATVGINGRVWSVASGQNATLLTNEFFMSGYNGQPAGAYGEFWSTPQDLSARVGEISANPWAYIYAPRTIWVPVSAAAAPSGFQAAWAHRQPRTIGAGVM